jgi:5-methylcytosine-specific restriction endonuclease McrA
MLTKVCSKCKCEKPLSEYTKHSKTKDGYYSQCKECKRKGRKSGGTDPKQKERFKKFLENNPEYIKNYVNNYERTHPDKKRERRKRYCESGLNAIMCHRRRAKEKNLDSNLTIEQWIIIKSYFNNECSYCGAKLKLTQDHFIALNNGGEYTTNNIIPACSKCNSSKQDKDFFEWYPKQSYYSKEREQKILEYLNYNIKNKVQQLALI